MPGRLVLRTSIDIADFSRDLRAFGDDLDKPLRDTLEYGARSIASGAKRFMRYRPEGAWATSSGARYGHIRDYYASKVATLSATVYSNHPAAGVWEFGGTIHPLLAGGHGLLRAHPQMRLTLASMDKDRPPWTFRIPPQRPVGTAGDAARQDIEQHLEDAIDALIKKHNL